MAMAAIAPAGVCRCIFLREAAADESTRMVKYDTEFHKTIIESSGNKTLINLIEQLDERMMRFRYAYFDNTRRAELIPPEHDKILNAIMNEDAGAAEEFAKDHIRRLKEVVTEEQISSK